MALSRGRSEGSRIRKLRGDEQNPDMRRGASGTSGHVTAKSSICGSWDALYKSGACATKETCLTRGDLHRSGLETVHKMTGNRH